MDKETSHTGVDLDGTLAFYDHYRGPTHIGPPIPRMLRRVHHWLRQGREVWIFTARVHPSKPDAEEARAAIEAWCTLHLGQTLPVTCEKDPDMVEFWDDRAHQVRRNTGLPVDPTVEALGRELADRLLEIAEEPPSRDYLARKNHRMEYAGQHGGMVHYCFADAPHVVVTLPAAYSADGRTFQLTPEVRMHWVWDAEVGQPVVTGAAHDHILALVLGDNKILDTHIFHVKPPP